MENIGALQAVFRRAHQGESRETLNPDIEEISKKILESGRHVERQVLLQVRVLMSSMGNDSPLELASDERRVIKGSISQFSGKEDSSACTSIAGCFARRILSLGRAWDIQPNEIDDVVRDGMEIYDLLYANSVIEAKTFGIKANQSLSYYDAMAPFGLETIGTQGEKVLQVKEDTTADFFEEELRHLERNFAEHGNIVGVIHAKGYTFQVALLNQGSYVEYVLFDSHGCVAINGTKEAFVAITRNRKMMAEYLALLCPYVKCEVGDLPGEMTAEIERDSNPYILYVVTTKEKEVLALKEPPKDEPKQSEVEPDPEQPKLEPKKEDEKVQKKIAEIDQKILKKKIQVFSALIFLSLIATGYSQRKYLWKQFPPVKKGPTGSAPLPVQG